MSDPLDSIKSISFDDEAAILGCIHRLANGAPWVCAGCAERITTDTWKPRLAFCGDENRLGFERVVIQVFCGDCLWRVQ